MSAVLHVVNVEALPTALRGRERSGAIVPGVPLSASQLRYRLTVTLPAAIDPSWHEDHAAHSAGA